MKTTTTLIFTVALALAVSACSEEVAAPLVTAPAIGLADFPLKKDTLRGWRLPVALEEVSGVALLGDDILMHDDEQAIVFRISLVTGDIDIHAVLGEPMILADLEGIAILGDDLYVIDSMGVLLKAAGAAATPGNYAVTRIDTGLGEICEIEGLSEGYEAGTLVVACKELREKGDFAPIYQVDPDTGTSTEIARIQFADVGEKVFPSGITPAFGGYLVVAAKDRLVLQIDRDGGVISVSELSKKRHPQAEGIAIAADGHWLFVADEGGQLVAYGCPQATCSGE